MISSIAFKNDIERIIVNAIREDVSPAGRLKEQYVAVVLKQFRCRKIRGACVR